MYHNIEVPSSRCNNSCAELGLLLAAAGDGPRPLVSSSPNTLGNRVSVLPTPSFDTIIIYSVSYSNLYSIMY